LLVLGIETATWMGSIALVNDQMGVLAAFNVNSTASHSERLLPAIERIFHETGKNLQDCDGICISIGPGSFTGLRIGLATAKGLAFAANKPLIGVSTLETLANGVPMARVPICPVIDARKKEVFTTIYEWRKNELVRLAPEMAIPPQWLIQKISKPTLLIGNGLIPYRDLFKKALQEKALFLSDAFNFPRASVLAHLGMKRLIRNETSNPEDLVPVYIRPSEAEINWKQD